MEKPRAEPERTKFDDLADSLKAGVKVVSAPQFFPTPPDLAARVVELADIRPGHTVLEPSAGTWNLVRAVREAAPAATITAVEVNGACRWPRFLEGGPGVHSHSRRLPLAQQELGQFDRIVMNRSSAERTLTHPPRLPIRLNHHA